MKCILVETLQKLKNLKELKIYEASDVSLPKKMFWSLEISYGVGDNFFWDVWELVATSYCSRRSKDMCMQISSGVAKGD